MKQEYWLALIIGLIIFAYVLDFVVNPLQITLVTPYHYFISESLSIYPFTTTSIVIKAIALFITPLLLLSFAGFSKLIKGIIVFIFAGLLQLYALQDVATGSLTVPLEWSLAFTLAGVLLIIPSIIYVLWGMIQKAGSVGVDSADDIRL